jgi:phospholipase/carboxylesterase
MLATGAFLSVVFLGKYNLPYCPQLDNITLVNTTKIIITAFKAISLCYKINANYITKARMAMAQSALETHIINPKKASRGSVIWMHGLGADQHDFDTLVPYLYNADQLPLRFIFPNAPLREVRIRPHIPVRAWYDLYSLTDLNQEDHAGIEASQHAISQLIQQEMDNGVPANRIVVAGFSQGGAIALYTGMRQTQPIAGILALSCYLPLMHEHAKTVHHTNKQTPIFIAHGTHDMTLPCFAGKMSYDVVHQTHPNAQWKEYATMGHEIAEPVVHDIRNFLTRVFE